MRNKYENIKIIKRLVKNSYDNYKNFEKIFDDQNKVIKINKDFGKVPTPPHQNGIFCYFPLAIAL